MTLSATTNATNDSPELEALFESIISAQQTAATEPTPAPAQHEFHNECGQVFSQVGHLTRKLHDTLRELGADQALEKASIAIPDACERLSYVATMTDQAAHRALAAIETARPIQSGLEESATSLNTQWDHFFQGQYDVAQFKNLVESTRAFLLDVPQKARATNAELHEIMMAQDFQDLTGQVIKRVTAAAQEMQGHLVQLLIDTVPDERRTVVEGNSLLNGPVINHHGRTDVVTNQQQVDELLQSLGF